MVCFKSFPGGMVDNEDIDVAHTARREAFEEIGLQASDVEIWGRLGTFPGKVCIDCWIWSSLP